MTSVLVTGSEGFLGRKLVTALEAKGYKVFGFDVSRGEDILNLEHLKKSFDTAKPKVVVHLAAIADLNIARKQPQLCIDINVKGTQNVLDFCEKYRARMLFASTCCIYGNSHKKGEKPSSEKGPIGPTEIYAKTKMDGEELIKKVQDEATGDQSLHHTIMRLATFYGPQMRGALAPAVFLQKVVAGQPIEIHGSGTQTRTYTYVDDIVSGIVTILDVHEKDNSRWYPIVNISTTETFSVLELAEMTMEACGKKVEIIHVADREGQIHWEEIDNQLLRSLGWEPQVNLKEGVRRSFLAL
jgi:nucleoside-diphosphate-sugar epimerase